MGHAEVDREEMRRSAEGSFLAAHRLVAAVVEASGREYSPKRMAAEIKKLAPEILGRKLWKLSEVWLRALDPKYFVGIRKVAGGPAPEAVKAQIANARKEQAEAHESLEAKRMLLENYPDLIRDAGAPCNYGPFRHKFEAQTVGDT
jgi:hypothetical protein